MKRIISLLLAALLLFSLVSCVSGNETEKSNETESITETQNEESENKTLGGSKLFSIKLTVSYEPNTVSKDEKFGAALLNVSQEEFENVGFVLGDSCNIAFQNGYTLLDVPYYNGYYVKNGSPVIVAYPGNPYVSITLNNQGIWDVAELQDGDSVTITLNEAGKYLDIQEALGQVYSFNRTDYTTDAEFCNFRVMSAGNLKENFLYRGASPVDNSRGRAAYTDGLLKDNGIKYVIDLADSETNMEKYLVDSTSEYVKAMYNNNQVVLLDMGSAYTSQTYKEKVVIGLRNAMAAEGPVYIHCMEGKDRTGFVCMLLEALAGASYDEMLSDYMLTYKNYFKVSKEETPEKYDAIAELYFVPFMAFLHDTEDMDTLINADYTEYAKAYLMDGGMTAEEIEELRVFITK